MRQPLHVLLVTDPLAVVGLSNPAVRTGFGLDDRELAALNEMAVSLLPDQVRMLKVALFASEALAIHECPTLLDRPGDHGQLDDVTRFGVLQVSVDIGDDAHPAMPAARELLQILGTPAVRSYEAVITETLRECAAKTAAVDLSDCPPLEYAVRQVKAGADPEKLLYAVSTDPEDLEALRSYSLITLMSYWMLAHPATSFPLIDSASAGAFGQLVVRRRSEGTSDPLTQALRAATMYVVRAVPQIGDLPVDEVLEWRAVLGESLEAFRSEVAKWTAVSSSVDASDVEDFLRTLAPQLDAAYLAVEVEAQDSHLWTVARKGAAGVVGATASFALGASTGGSFASVATLSGLGGVALGHAVASVYDTLKNRRSLLRRPMYWRYRLKQGLLSTHPSLSRAERRAARRR
jgi:hypothetical protein